MAEPRESPEEKLLRQAKSPADAAYLTKFNSRMALPLIMAAVIPLFIVPGSPNDTVAAGLVVVLSWIVFVIDYVVHSRRLNGYLATWVGKFDLAVVLLTAPWFLLLPGTASRFVLAIRLARLARLVMASSGARRLFDRLGKVALVAVTVVVVGAAIGYYAEHPTNSEFKTFGDALWWSIVTLTTVGYGDIVPKTFAGRVDAAMIMITGVAILGLLAGSLASFFRLAPPPGSAAAIAEAADNPSEEVANELAALRAEVARLADVVASLQRDGPASG